MKVEIFHLSLSPLLFSKSICTKSLKIVQPEYESASTLKGLKSQ